MKCCLVAALNLCLLCFTTACKTAGSAEVKSQTNTTTSTEQDQKLEGDLKYIKTNASQMVEKSAHELGNPANRDFHSKGMCTRGKFTVTSSNIPEAYRVGIFAQDGVYPMYARFSNGRPGRNSDDKNGSVFGFGIKLLDVPGQKFDMQKLGSTKPRNSNQDWNLATGETFPIPTADIYRQQREFSTAFFAAKHPLITAALLRSLRHIDSFLSTEYHSQVALHYGEDFVAKFSVVPCSGAKADISSAEGSQRGSDYLREDLKAKLSQESACFVFRAQIRPSDNNLHAPMTNWNKTYPSDNPTILWSKSDIPVHEIARIELPKQPNIDKYQSECEALSINPGNTLEVFRPIESDTLMKSRFLSAYEGSVTTRSSINGAVQSEPGQVPSLEEWLR
jgi:catalase